jgi:adenylate cyclase
VEVSEIRVETPDGPRSYVAMTRKIAGYSDQLWTIGAYFESRELSTELRRAGLSGLVGLGALAAAIIAAILLGKRLSRPVQAIAGHARQVADFDLDNIQPLPRSRVRELDDQASAFNAMLIGLRAFSTYIPRSLVAKLVRSGEVGIAEPREAVVTVMFTDIAAFTTLSERMDASETTKLLNHHFGILCRVVDEHGGTVDKFLGDGLMAFFGAPDRLEEHAECATLAALRIREELAADNARASLEGRQPLTVRIGIHTGPVTVGNIGASDRVNYTIIGDTVNVSQRLQGLGKTLARGEETPIVISSETASRLDDSFDVVSAGRHLLRGRGEPTEVFVVGARKARATGVRSLAG